MAVIVSTINGPTQQKVQAFDNETKPSWKRHGGGMRELVATTHRTRKYLEFTMEELDRATGHRRVTHFSMDEYVAAEFMQQLNEVMAVTV